jgi:hypothetical protein
MKYKLIIFGLLLLTTSTAAQKEVYFSVQNLPETGMYKVGVRGNSSPLSWFETFYLTEENGVGKGSINIDQLVDFFEYKYVIESQEGETVFELDGQENRLGIFKEQGNLMLDDVWDEMPQYAVDELPLLPVAKLQKDVDILSEALWTLHPGIERYQDSSMYFKSVQALRNRLNKPTSYADAYKEISWFTAKVKCGHTYANPFNQTGFIKNIILNQPDKLPFGLEWIDERLYITKNATENPLFKSGTEIKAINGVPTSELASQLLSMTKADGSNDAKRFESLKVVGYNTYESFDVYFPLLIPPIHGMYSLSIVSSNGAILEAEVEATNRETRNKLLQERYPTIPKNIDETWTHKMIAPSIAYLKMGTFVIWDFKMDYKKYLSETFKSFDSAGANHLIIDIRGNEGGADEVLAELQKYTLKEDCSLENFDERIRYQTVPENLRPYLQTWDEQILDFSDRVKENEDGSYSFKNNPEISNYKGSKKAFEGDIYVLINAGNSSATFYLARFVKKCSMGTLVGEPTGGNLKGINGGNMFFLRLPHTRIEVDIPIYGQFDDEAPDRGIQPEIEIKRTPEMIQKEMDGQLEQLIDFIQNQ